MYWRAYISCHRKEFDLLHVATGKFNYKYNYSTADASDLHYGTGGSPLRVNMMGPIVPISAILAQVASKYLEREKKTA